ncbi:MAG: T3SS (YopN, CesT) and YbjN peptide-binding chaperone 1 [Roseiflexaceae bacterium]
MPRFHFRWHNISPDLLEIIANCADIHPPTTAALMAALGPVPPHDFVERHYECFVNYWLLSEPDDAAQFAQQLRTHALGDCTIIDPNQYIMSCQSDPLFGQLLHQAFVVKGQQRYDAVKLQTPPAAAASAQTEADAFAQMYALVHDTLRDAIDTTQLAITNDGAFAVNAGSCVVHINLHVTPRVVRIHAALVVDVGASPALFESLNSINSQLPMGRMFFQDGAIYIESSLFESTLTAKSLVTVVSHIAYLADLHDDRLRHAFGGKLIREIPPHDQIDA